MGAGVVVRDHTVTRLPCCLILSFLLLSTRHNAAASENGVHAGASRSLASCLVASGVRNFSLAGSPGYASLLGFSVQNLRFALPGVRKPDAVVLPASRRDLQRAVLCARRAAAAIRVRSGGHSYEGQSYTVAGAALGDGDAPFVVVDLMNLNRVRVDAASATAWAESGATLGEVYHAVARSASPNGSSSSSSLAFAAGSCSTVGVGGHVSGGGFGLLSRKFMLAADNVLDALLVDAEGRVLDRGAMGEDVFWAIRGSRGGSWGVVYAWKLRLVPVLDTVTLFTPGREGSVDAIARLVHRWQFVGPALPDEFYLSVFLTIGGASQEDTNVTVSFTGLVLRPRELAMSVPSERFPELDLAETELSEMSWNKSDYVKQPIARDALAAILRYLSAGPAGYVILDPYGGAMARAGATDTPFPHRAGNLYGVTWEAGEDGEARMAWLRALYACMAPHVSCSPRAAYVNYINLDLGTAAAANAANGSAATAVGRARATWSRPTSPPRTSIGSSGPRRASILPMSSTTPRVYHHCKGTVECLNLHRE
ncbi:hypothetical protein GQ55_6G149600 [Panicum hallii var. hallii]|uniref:FAD-binding PCMH-type domain-containing protein n=1 Tax=Panicum hallii var. hallii TaxID=1504633 RepID=A0A2T7D6B7_9POAL|nr:hypothetical protein GQ55_6G149600 [Panicum hallii var. hallii]